MDPKLNIDLQLAVVEKAPIRHGVKKAERASAGWEQGMSERMIAAGTLLDEQGIAAITAISLKRDSRLIECTLVVLLVVLAILLLT